MTWGDLYYDPTEDCLAFRERQTKTRTGSTTEIRPMVPKAFRNKENPDRCPVALYLEFKKRRPQPMLEDEAPFYLAINYKRQPFSEIWYKCAPMGSNVIGNFMKDMAKKVGLSGRKTNHSVRKMAITQLLHAGYTPTHIKAISGHKNEASIANYAVPSKVQHREMGEVLLNNKSKIQPNVSASGLALVPSTSSIAAVNEKAVPTATDSNPPVEFLQSQSPSIPRRPLQQHAQAPFQGADCRNATIYFNIYSHKTSENSFTLSQTSSEPPPKRRRILPIVSDTDSDCEN